MTPSRAGRPLPARLRSIFCLEFCYALFVHAGIFKSGIGEDLLPFDLTLIFAVLTLVGAALLLSGGRVKPDVTRVRGTLAMLLAFGYAATTHGWSRNPGFADSRIYFNLPLTFLAFFVACIVVSSERERVRRFLNSMLFVGFFVVFVTLYALIFMPVTVGVGLDLQNSADYIARGKSLTESMARCYALLLCAGTTFSRRFGFAAAVAGFLILVFISGSRQALVSAGLILILPILYDFLLPVSKLRERFLRIRAYAMMLIIAVAGTGAIAMSRPEILTTFMRIQAIEEERPETEGGETIRPKLRELAIKDWERNPMFGIGIGSFGHIHGFNNRDHPHNTPIEMLAELGIVGLVLMGGAVLVTCRRIDRFSQIIRDTERLNIVFGVMMVATSAMVSTSWTEHRHLFAYLGLLPFLAPPRAGSQTVMDG
ncbi:MAG: hypothetical protein HONBIEJF_00816 [Fimbriimonadaceae bacterium]|nr:hypothetical protein [Fimbriimonadaceae bacterium]